VDFLGGRRVGATRADYTSCPREDPGGPQWVLEADRVTLDLDRNQGFAEGARLRFLGVPILALPGMSFPLSDDRKSGWLPPSFDISNRSGVEVAVPYYWNIAPQRDATITPRVMSRRGFGVEGEYRWLEPRHQGLVAADWIPNDRVTGTSRSAWRLDGGAALPQAVRLKAELIRVSDDDWWKDFPRSQQHIVPRLLPAAVQAERDLAFAGAEGLAYARVLQWQVLQDPQALIDEPYARDLQLGAAGFGRAGPGLEYRLETELNQFSRPLATADGSPPLGQRLHVLGSLARPWRDAGWWLVPRLSFNAAGYHTEQPMSDGQRSASRLIPTFSIDSGLEFERPTEAFGRTLRQTLEPRVMYVNTPYRDQGALPNFDAAGKDFNFDSIFSDNDFSGVDRVSDAHRITAGLTSRLVDDSSGVELLRLGVVQRYQLRDQLVTPDGVPITQPWSDLLLLGSTNLLPHWVLDASVQYDADIARPVRAVLGARWSPGPFRTVAASYRLVRGSSEQAAVGWQWPLTRAKAGAGERCSRAWYSVGRINYSLKDSRITDSIVGFEVDAGCWVGRIVAERQSTGVSEATTRLLLQVELVGLSRIGSNPLRVLKDNIPGYRLLREERGTLPAPDAP
jgi:LPS-assembly protein